MNYSVFFLFLSLVFCAPLSATNGTQLEELYSEAIEEPEAAVFIPPIGWLAADPSMLPPSVQAMVIGQGEKEYPPSINLGLEAYEGSIKSYLKNIKHINTSQHATWKDLGQIQTESGNASLSQVDMKTEWGDVRLLHAIQIRYGTAYILTCACLKEEFSKHYKNFVQTIRSMKINKDVFEQVKNPQKRTKLQTLFQTVKREWKKELEKLQEEEEKLPPQELFSTCLDSTSFQERVWVPFQERLDKEFEEMGTAWKEHVLSKAKRDLAKE